MENIIKKEEVQMSVPIKKQQPKKEKIGRWSTAEAYLFESLLERFGKNWKKIHQHMKNRSLSQIRSHAQKYFDKIEPKKVQEYERRAKLLEAFETLEKEKLIRENPPASESASEMSSQDLVKQEEQSPLTGSEQNAKPVEESNIKEQAIKQSHQQTIIPSTPMDYFPLFSRMAYTDGGYLLQLINLYPETFYRYQGIEGFVDNSAFRVYNPNTQ